MLNQAQVTTQYTSPALSVVPVKRSASESRAFVILQSVLIKGTNEAYLTHPDFHEGFENGYAYEDEIGEFEDLEITLDHVLHFVEHEFSFTVYLQDNKLSAICQTQPIHYAQRIGFVLGFLRWMFDADRAPWIPLSLLQKWYSIEYLTRSVAARFVAHE